MSLSRHRYNLRPRPLTGANIARDSLYHVFSRFSLPELAPLRLVSRAWNALVLAKFAQRQELTIQVTCEHELEQHSRSQYDSTVMFYLTDILAAFKAIAPQGENVIIESIGEVLTLREDTLSCLVPFFPNLRGIIIHWKRCGACPLKNLMPVLAKLVAATPQLHRFSLSTDLKLPLRLLRLPPPPELSLAPLCTALKATTHTLVQLHFNCFQNFELYLDEADSLDHLLPRLEHLTLGGVRLPEETIHRHLPQLGETLIALKLDWNCFDRSLGLIESPESVASSVAAFRQSVQQLADRGNSATLTTLALDGFPSWAITNFCQHFTALKELTLRKSPHTYFRPDLIRPLQALPQLTWLTLIDYHLQPTQPIYNALPSITKLTLASEHLLLDFTTELNPDDRQYYRLNVSTFIGALFELFPNLRQLTLIGRISYAEATQQRLQTALDGRLDLLNLFIQSHPPIGVAPFGRRQMARKCFL